MANIKDVAKLAGVSVSTVSLLLNGKNVSPEKHKRIIDAMKELDYRPSMLARNMKKQHLHFIGVVLPSIEGHYHHILKGILSVVEGGDYNVIIKTSNYNSQKEEEIINNLKDIGISGIIICPSDVRKPEKYVEMLGGLPTIVIERKLEMIETYNFGSVVFDNRKIIFDKTMELLENYSPTDIVLITGPLYISDENECKEGFEVAIQSAGGKANVFSTTLEISRSIKELIDYFGDNCSEKCFIATNRNIAEALLEIFHVYKQQKVIYSLDGDVWSKSLRLNNQIRPIPRDAQKLGKVAANSVLRYIKNKRPEDVKNIIIDSSYNFKDPVYVPRVEIQQIKPLRALVLSSNAIDVLMNLTSNFTRKTGIPVEYTMKNFDWIRNALTEEDGTFPDHDVLFVDIPLIDTLGRRGKLLNLTNMVNDDPNKIIDLFPEGIKKCFFTHKSGIYGLPIQACEGMFFYRKDIFNDVDIKWQFYKKYGFELRPPKTWAEFNYLAEFFNSDNNPDSPVKYGTSIATMCPTGGFMEEFYIRQRAFHGKMVDEWGKLCVNSLENQRALNNMITTYKNSPPNSFGFFYDDVFRCLLSGDIAFAEGFPTHYLPLSYKELLRKNEYQIGIAPIPGGKPILGAWVLSVNAATSVPKQAYDFISWAVSQDISMISGLMGGVIPVKDTFESSLLDEHYPWINMHDVNNFSKSLRETIYKHNGDVLDHYIVENILSKEFSKAFTSELTVKQAVDNAQNILLKLISE